MKSGIKVQCSTDTKETTFTFSYWEVQKIEGSRSSYLYTNIPLQTNHLKWPLKTDIKTQKET